MHIIRVIWVIAKNKTPSQTCQQHHPHKTLTYRRIRQFNLLPLQPSHVKPRWLLFHGSVKIPTLSLTQRRRWARAKLWIHPGVADVYVVIVDQRHITWCYWFEILQRSRLNCGFNVKLSWNIHQWVNSCALRWKICRSMHVTKYPIVNGFVSHVEYE